MCVEFFEILNIVVFREVLKILAFLVRFQRTHVYENVWITLVKTVSNYELPMVMNQITSFWVNFQVG